MNKPDLKHLDEWMSARMAILDKDINKSNIPRQNASVRSILSWGTQAFSRDEYHNDIKDGGIEPKLCNDCWAAYKKNGSLPSDLHTIRLCLHFEEARARFGFVTKLIYPKWRKYIKALNTQLHNAFN